MPEALNRLAAGSRGRQKLRPSETKVKGGFCFCNATLDKCR